MVIAAIIQELTNWVYTQSMDTIARSCVICALIFCTLFRKYSGEKWLRLCVGAALASWFGVVLWMTVLGRIPDVGYEAHWIPLHTYWAVLFGAHQEMLRSCFMNAVLFYPAGLFLAGLMPENRSYRKGVLCTALIFALFSLAIELSQYFWQLGKCEIDDVLHNTLGAGLGYAAFYLDLDDKSQSNWR